MGRKTVFFLGAGATRDVISSAPVNKDLVKKALEDFGNTPEGISVWSFIGNLFTGRNLPPVDNQIWNLLDFIVQEGKSPSSSYNLEQISEIRNNLLTLIIKEFKKSLNPQLIPHDTYKDFVNVIVDSESSIISTNYDIFIDNALTGHQCFNYGVKIRVAVAELESNRKISGFKRPSRSGETRINTGKIKLLKIHGSLNWLYCNKCNEVDIAIGEKLDADALKELYCSYEHCTNRYEPLLVTPTMFKDYENRIIKESWIHAEKELKAADNLIFIGYALKDEDYQIRCLLMKALLNKPEGYKKVIVIDKKPEDDEERQLLKENVENKYRNLYGDIVKFELIRFAEFVKTIRNFDLSNEC